MIHLGFFNSSDRRPGRYAGLAEGPEEKAALLESGRFVVSGDPETLVADAIRELRLYAETKRADPFFLRVARETIEILVERRNDVPPATKLRAHAALVAAYPGSCSPSLAPILVDATKGWSEDDMDDEGRIEVALCDDSRPWAISRETFHAIPSEEFAKAWELAGRDPFRIHA